MNFLKDIAKEIDNEYASLVSDGVSAGDTNNFIDTGSYIFNGLVSGSIFGGIPGNKITALAGESSTGKTYFCLGLVEHFLKSSDDSGVIYFESESAISKRLIEDRGIDSSRMMLVPVTTVQEFRTQAIRILDKYLQQPQEDRKPLMFVLDSLGMLSTTKELEDSQGNSGDGEVEKVQ